MQTLLDHQHWVEELARRLVRDPHVAADIAQETVLLALERRDAERRSMRAWLATVARNLVWERLRTEERRRAREGARAPAEDSPSTVELVERMETHKLVVETVMGLPDHYREVLLRRYFEGETPTRISESLSIPISTVKTRLARAHEAMRERLDRKCGNDGRAWLNALAPLAMGRSSLSVKVPAFAWGAVAAVAVVALGALAWNAATPEQALEQDARPVAALDRWEPPRDEEFEDAVPIAPERQAVDAEPNDAEDDFAVVQRTMSPERRLRGRVLSSDGGAVSGMVVRLDPYRSKNVDDPGAGAAIAITDASGAFEFAGAPGRGSVHAASDDLVTVLAGESANEGSVTLVVAPRNPLAGVVTDEAGRALSGATVELVLPSDFRGRFASALDAAADVRFRAETDGDGRFAVEDAPFVEGALLVARLEGYEPGEWNVALEEGERTLVLERPTFEEGMLRGVVVGPDGRPVAGARVACGFEVAATDETGAFLLRVDDLHPFSDRAIAMKAGFAPAVLPRSEFSDQVELRLGDEARSIRGKVVDAQGRALHGIAVWLADPTVFAPPVELRDEREATQKSVSTRVLRRGAVPDLLMPTVVESFLSGEEDVPWIYVRTDRNGEFELEGLMDREYELDAMDFDTLARAPTRKVAAGRDDVEIVLDTSLSRPEVQGIVVDRWGRPVAGVQVKLTADAFVVRHDRGVMVADQKARTAMRTGPDGVFWVRDMPPDAFLEFESRATLGRSFGRGDPDESTALDAGEYLRIQVERWIRLRVELADVAEADAFSILDETGDVLALVSQRGNKRVSVARATLTDGVSEGLRVSDAAAFAVLFADGSEVRREPIPPAGAGAMTLRF